MPKEIILVTGSSGLIGNELVPALIKKYGQENVIASDLNEPTNYSCKSVAIDITRPEVISKTVGDYHITTVYHLAGLLSAGSEENPDLGWRINFGGLKNILDVAKENKLKVFWPSSIAAFGPTTPQKNTPQHTILEPTTIYGIAKVSGELMCQYYFNKYGVDVRSLRYPGIIGWRGKAGAGTTEYSIHMLNAALSSGKYDCFLKKDTLLPMMYIDDTIRGTIELMEAPADKIKVRTAYNFSAISFTPEQLTKEIQKHLEISVKYEPDFRQKIADTWPESIDDSAARADWHWQPTYDLEKLVEIMLKQLGTIAKQEVRAQ